MSAWVKKAVMSPLLHFFVGGVIIYSLVPEDQEAVALKERRDAQEGE